jgi:predicted Zn-dependent protease
MKHPKWLSASICASALLFSVGAFAQDKAKNEYPNATREDPKVSMSSGDQRDLNKATDLVNEGNVTEAQPLIEKVLGNDRASPYAQAFAHQLMAQVYWEQDNGPQAISEYKQAIALDALPNSAQFQLVYALAQTELQEEKYQDALATLAEWEKLTGAQTGDELALKANAYYRTDQYQLAIDTMKKAMAVDGGEVKESWSQILMASYFELDQYDEAAALVKGQLAKNPTDKKLINNLATIYVQGDKPEQAIEVMANAKAQGLITTEADYVQLAKLYSAADKPKDAAATMQDGFAKGIIKPSLDSYKLHGDVCTLAENDACAIDAYTKAAPFAEDGNVEYQLGYLQYYADKPGDAVSALDKAISKGSLRQEGEAYLLRGDAKNELGQEQAAMTDWRKAAGYPSTKSMADQRIKAASGGVKIKRAKKN